MQYDRFAEKVALKENIACVDSLAEFVLGLDLFSKQPNMWRKYFAQTSTFLWISCDAEVYLDDIRQVDQWFITGQENKVIKGNFVALVF